MTEQKLWQKAFQEAEEAFAQAEDESGETISYTAGYELVKSRLISGSISASQAEIELAQHHEKFREEFIKSQL